MMLIARCLRNTDLSLQVRNNVMMMDDRAPAMERKSCYGEWHLTYLAI